MAYYITYRYCNGRICTTWTDDIKELTRILTNIHEDPDCNLISVVPDKT